MLPHNQRMKDFLASHGIRCTPKWIPDGSLKRSWRLNQKGQKWTLELAAKLNALGFTDLNHKPLGQYSGNGGMFQVFVRGHEELLEGA